METTGRPDGLEPHGFESLLVYHQNRAQTAERGEEAFTLTVQEVAELQAEGLQYYHRYITLYQLGEFDLVVRDTRRNLELFDFVSDFAPDPETAWSVEQFRPYVTMMNARAKAHLALGRGDTQAAIRLVEKGLQRIEDFYASVGNDDLREASPELRFLSDWLKELEQQALEEVGSVSVAARLRSEMAEAVRTEDYERAASLRDRIRALATEGDQNAGLYEA
jgi:hypothetical protein